MEKNEMIEMTDKPENKAKENVVIDDFYFSLIADFFKRVDRQGPLEARLQDFWSYCKLSSGSCNKSTS